MKILFLLIIIFFNASLCQGSECLYEIRTSMRDIFCIQKNENWEIEVEKILTLRFANIRITPKDRSFSLMLYFKSDTPDLSQFDTPGKIKKSIIRSSRQYLPYVLEKEVKLERFASKNSYGFINILTDKELINKVKLAEGEFIYLSRGMVRLSKDSALGFSLMTNELKTYNYNEILDYILNFIKD